MDLSLKKIIIENFKSYGNKAEIDISDISVFLGANSSGKSTALQALLALKQTTECNSFGIDLLLCGKYVTLGDFDDVINDDQKGYFKIGVLLENTGKNEKSEGILHYQIEWKFIKDDKNSGVKLDSIIIQQNSNIITIRSEKDNQFRVFFNDQITELSALLTNLQLRNLIIHFDKSFNVIYKEFIDEIIKHIYGNKSWRADSKNPIFLRDSEYMYIYLTRNRYTSNDEVIDDKREVELVSTRLVDLLNQYSLMQGKYMQSYAEIPDEIKINILSNAIYHSEEIEVFDNIYKIYKNKLEEYKKNIPPLKAWEGTYPLQGHIFSIRDEKNSSQEIDDIQFSMDVYYNFQRKILKNIFFVGPIRENPQGLYNIGFDTIPKYVGPTGAYFASVLLHQNRVKEYFFPDNETETTTLLEALDAWMEHLNIASQVKVDRNNSFGFSVSIANTQNQVSDIMNVGIGTSQVLPVLITGLLSEPNEVLMFEQPELHLHPYSQSRLADFFVELIKHGRKVIIETHSEYFILRLRYHVLTKSVASDQISICFFQNKGETKVKHCEISGFGNLDYPEDFYDETQELLNELMNAALMKRDNEC